MLGPVQVCRCLIRGLVLMPTMVSQCPKPEAHDTSLSNRWFSERHWFQAKAVRERRGRLLTVPRAASALHCIPSHCYADQGSLAGS